MIRCALPGGILTAEQYLNLDEIADEFANGNVPGSVHIPYGELTDRLSELPADGAIATICSGGKRSGLAASILQREGFDHVVHVGHGGVSSWLRNQRPE